MQIFLTEHFDTRINNTVHFIVKKEGFCTQNDNIMLHVCITQSIMGGVVPKIETFS